MEKYVWEGSKSQGVIEGVLRLEGSMVREYKDVVLKLHNEGEDGKIVEQYGKCVRDLLNLPTL